MKAKPFEVSSYLVYNAFKQVRSNRCSGGVDGISLAEYSKDCVSHLYKLWDQLSSGSYVPPAVRLKEIKKKDGGIRTLGIPTVSDRIAQTAVKSHIELGLESIYYHEDSYGYRPKKSAVEAVAKARERCWKHNWGDRP